MSITKKEVEHVASLARLQLSNEEVERFASQLSDILQFARKLNALDTENIEPTSHVLPMTNVLREDVVQPSLDKEKALQNAPDQHQQMFRVPTVFEE